MVKVGEMFHLGKKPNIIQYMSYEMEMADRAASLIDTGLDAEKPRSADANRGQCSTGKWGYSSG